jgi:hypothetical protein
MMKLKGSWSARYVTWNCAFSGASKSTTRRRDSVEYVMVEACVYIKQLSIKKYVHIEYNYI